MLRSTSSRIRTSSKLQHQYLQQPQRSYYTHRLPIRVLDLTKRPIQLTTRSLFTSSRTISRRKPPSCSTLISTTSLCPSCLASSSPRFFSSSSSSSSPPLTPTQHRLSLIRNIGIIAHIDAGKTTTTERLLYYTNTIRHMGDVDRGNTAMDFLEEERERGITIKSACVTFEWTATKPIPSLTSSNPSQPQPSSSKSKRPDASSSSSPSCRINLIDTPGHVDFTIEVESSLRVCDSCVVVIDANKGVEAQTETVWQQAKRYGISAVVLINKMDREGANPIQAVESVRKRLNVSTLLLQLPIYTPPDSPSSSPSSSSSLPPHLFTSSTANMTTSSTFTGILDLLSLTIHLWSLPDSSSDNGSTYLSYALPVEHQLYEEAVKAREELVEKIVDMDEEMGELFLEWSERNAAEGGGEKSTRGYLGLPVERLDAAIRRLTLANKVAPVLFGSALKNKAIQPVLDAVVRYLPSPLDRNTLTATHYKSSHLIPLTLTSSSSRSSSSSEPLLALAFKVTHDLSRGILPIVYLRVYSGSINEKDPLFNTNREERERILKLLEVNGEENKEVKTIEVGNIGAIVGLKHTKTGDTIMKYMEKEEKRVILPSVSIPPAVFFAAVEAASSTAQTQLDLALTCLQREDPSLRVHIDGDTGQTIISSMGELHMEIVKNRLMKDYKVDCEIGKMRVSYREGVGMETEEEMVVIQNATAGMSEQAAVLRLKVEPITVDEDETVPSSSSSSSSSSLSNEILFPLPGSPSPTYTPDEATSIAKRLNQLIVFLGPSSPLTPALQASIEAGIRDALNRGPLLGYPVVRTRVRVLKWYIPPTNAGTVAKTSGAAVSPSSSPSSSPGALIFRSCAHRLMRSLLVSPASGTTLLEPVMLAEISAMRKDVGEVVNDLNSGRRAMIRTVGMERGGGEGEEGEGEGGMKEGRGSDRNVIVGEVPLSEMMGYANLLRSRTAGTGSFVMNFLSYRMVPTHVQLRLIESPP